MKEFVKILGTGGAFDAESRNSSFLVSHFGRKFLVDCGETVFSTLKLRFPFSGLEEITDVIITHCHSDHIGSLSTLIFYNFFILKKKTTIHADFYVARDIFKYLSISGHSQDQFDIIQYAPLNEQENLEKYGIKIIPTHNLHVKDFFSSGIEFYDESLSNSILTISGDIGVPIYELDSFKISEETTVFHDASPYDSEVHCFYMKLLPYRKKKLFVYHHSNQDTSDFNKKGLKSVIFFKGCNF